STLVREILHPFIGFCPLGNVGQTAREASILQRLIPVDVALGVESVADIGQHVGERLQFLVLFDLARPEGSHPHPVPASSRRPCVALMVVLAAVEPGPATRQEIRIKKAMARSLLQYRRYSLEGAEKDADDLRTCQIAPGHR